MCSNLGVQEGIFLPSDHYRSSTIRRKNVYIERWLLNKI